jgi:hypothetical protein
MFWKGTPNGDYRQILKGTEYLTCFRSRTIRHWRTKCERCYSLKHLVSDFKDTGTKDEDVCNKTRKERAATEVVNYILLDRNIE